MAAADDFSRSLRAPFLFCARTPSRGVAPGYDVRPLRGRVSTSSRSANLVVLAPLSRSLLGIGCWILDIRFRCPSHLASFTRAVPRSYKCVGFSGVIGAPLRGANGILDSRAMRYGAEFVRIPPELLPVPLRPRNVERRTPNVEGGHRVLRSFLARRDSAVRRSAVPRFS